MALRGSRGQNNVVYANDVCAKPEPLVQKSGTRGSGLPNFYSRFALCCASRTAALATMAVILLAVVRNAAGDAAGAAAGQWMSTAAGSLSGSLRTMTSSSVGVMSPRARTSLGLVDS